jgi:hypothetical protein
MKTAGREARKRVANPVLHDAYIFPINVVFLAFVGILRLITKDLDFSQARAVPLVSVSVGFVTFSELGWTSLVQHGSK